MLFVPPIVKLCQTTGVSQFAISRLFWLFAALDGFYHAETTFGSILWGTVSVLMLLAAARRGDSPTRSIVWFRLLAIVALGFDAVISVGTGTWSGIEFWVLVLVAKYATTIVTIPPTDDARRASGSKNTATVTQRGPR